jgi:hypothetical protein
LVLTGVSDIEKVYPSEGRGHVQIPEPEKGNGKQLPVRKKFLLKNN